MESSVLSCEFVEIRTPFDKLSEESESDKFNSMSDGVSGAVVVPAHGEPVEP